MASHREAALDRRRGPARPWLGNRPATSSLGGCRGGLILDRCATGATPRGRSIMVSSSVLGHGNAAPWSSPRPSPRPSSISSSGKKKSHPPVLGGPPLKAPSIQTSSSDTVASAPSMSTSESVNGYTHDGRGSTCRCRAARHKGGDCPASRLGRAGTDTSTSTLRRRLPGARTPSWSRGAWTADLVLAAVERWARGRRGGGRARRG